MHQKRDKTIDVLRFIAIIAIIIAHIDPPDLLFRLRNFDVTLMVMLMGVSFYISQSNKSLNYGSYIYKRFQRLIVSTWKFLVLFFLLFWTLAKLRGEAFYFETEMILESFKLIDGIGYVWVMYVFFIVALVSPVLLALSKRIKSHLVYFLILTVAYGLYYITINASQAISGETAVTIKEYLIQPIGYVLIAAVGIRFKQLSKRNLMLGTGILLVLFTALAYTNNYLPIQAFKYPPTMYYMSYGLLVSFALYQLLSLRAVTRFVHNKFVFYYSNASLILYFWHVVPLYLLKFYDIPIIPDHFITRLLFVLGFSLLMTYIQDRLTTTVNNRINKQKKKATPLTEIIEQQQEDLTRTV
ncbi:acyltransferase family protein [Bacillus suaedae]|uniref:Acyltransferase n=1 Tax=Halalkalibacter suaedae TaxID=2822140 RepID=A0A940X1K1_9BACI|nr:acyltransferase family protein [Bacillus suaedae]MBP3953169.1 acyltransferase [Bacillus suaedae]